MPTLRDNLRAIIHQLRMETLLNVEPSAIIGLRSRILMLPNPEKVNTFNKKELEKLRNIVEMLVFELDEATNHRSKDRAIRDMVKKNIGPYRKALLASKYVFKCPYCHKTLYNGKWQSGFSNSDDFNFLQLACPSCRNKKTLSKNWYSFYKTM